MDGLPMPEDNPDLEYKTKTDFAHMCGHDGHMAMLLAAAQVLAKNTHKIAKGSGNPELITTPSLPSECGIKRTVT